jgi:hypothetical protein
MSLTNYFVEFYSDRRKAGESQPRAPGQNDDM